MFSFPEYITDLTAFINSKSNSIFELNDYAYDQVKSYRDSIDKFILDYADEMESLDYSKLESRAFLFLLFDLCERLQLTTCFEQLCLLVAEKQIEMSGRQKAAVFYSINIAYNRDYIDRFDKICIHLTQAEELEDLNRILATFINYYLTVLEIHPTWIIELKKAIFQAQDKYNFLNQRVIQQITAIPTENVRKAYEQIQEIKDQLLKRRPIIHYSSDTIEISEYADLLKAQENVSFDSIRQIAVNRARNSSAREISTKPLETEDEMSLYLRNYGNMHYAKMLSALQYLPLNEITGDIEIIDWGCGQALASLVLLEYISRHSEYSNLHINRITLVEPSEIAIKRGALHITVLNNKIPIRLVQKYLDDIAPEEISAKEQTTVHLFSNILDVEEFSIPHLVQTIIESQKGTQYFLCASPYINDIRSLRIIRFAKSIETLCTHFITYGIEKITKADAEYWECNKHYKRQSCEQQQSCGLCHNKWTKDINVFSAHLTV